MKIYFAIVHKDADSAYGLTFPDLPGCFSAADTIEDLVKNAAEALDLWFEDADEVAPAEASAIAAAHAADLAEGAFLVAVPYIAKAGKAVRVNLSLDRGTLEAIDAAAAARHLTRSAWLTQAARNEIVMAR
ncbi:type II toxin-antitoxin system HicB family antitoxin [Sphingomonas pituitosa]|uniref:type II toxin-antitoxin system HicB family antitoxin n=1 Tax=Sphingomonas pituitosa TaxID=99597 RepID=UPI0008372C15|nr:type II toxin-antitoxin system HicB family antitoxin [Sphingomonas pituitosa]